MLKYTNAQVTFSEIPDEITLCINLSNCPNNCFGCHSPYLKEDIGELLTITKLQELIQNNNGISCIALMGGDINPMLINDYADYIKWRFNLKVAWYSGNELLDQDIKLVNFDFIKLGPYMQEFGPLNVKTTNQRFYKVEDDKLVDITYKFWKDDKSDN